MFFDDIQYHLKDEFHEEGNNIHLKGDLCRQLVFVVKGKIELQMETKSGLRLVLDELYPGANIG